MAVTIAPASGDRRGISFSRVERLSLRENVASKSIEDTRAGALDVKSLNPVGVEDPEDLLRVSLRSETRVAGSISVEIGRSDLSITESESSPNERNIRTILSGSLMRYTTKDSVDLKLSASINCDLDKPRLVALFLLRGLGSG
tara:strand:- start:19 stop:447 length:429 start_codon:yes stop_codon:yes gene_type:complete